MPNYTKKAIMQTFEEMLDRMPFDKITVSSIVKQCEISSNTFYYHFRNIYDLLDQWLMLQKQILDEGHPEHSDWQSQLRCIMHRMQDHPRPVYHIFRSLSRDTLERLILEPGQQFFCEMIRQRPDMAAASDEMVAEIAKFYYYAVTGFLIEFIRHRMKADVDLAVDTFARGMRDMAPYLLEKLTGTGEVGPGTD